MQKLNGYTLNGHQITNPAVLRLERLEYDAVGKPAYAEYDGYGKLLNYTPVEEKHRWNPWPVIIGVGITAFVAFNVIAGYLEKSEYTQDKAKFMEHAVLTKGWSTDRASKAWDQIQDGPDSQE